MFGMFALLFAGYLLGKSIELMIKTVKIYNGLFREEKRI